MRLRGSHGAGASIAELGPVLDIDLRAQTIATPAGHSFRFSIHPLIKRRMMQGMDEIALTKTYRDRIDAFEARHLADYFWLLRGPASWLKPQQ